MADKVNVSDDDVSTPFVCGGITYQLPILRWRALRQAYPLIRSIGQTAQMMREIQDDEARERFWIEMNDLCIMVFALAYEQRCTGWLAKDFEERLKFEELSELQAVFNTLMKNTGFKDQEAVPGEVLPSSVEASRSTGTSADSSLSLSPTELKEVPGTV